MRRDSPLRDDVLYAIVVECPRDPGHDCRAVDVPGRADRYRQCRACRPYIVWAGVASREARAE